MDLFFDIDYINDCENKLDYYRVLYAPVSTIPSNYEFTLAPEKKFISGDAVFAVIPTGVDIQDVHLINVDTGVYCQEKVIAQKLKKFILL